MKNLLQSNPEATIELLQGELDKLRFNSRKDIKRLVLKKK